MIMLTGAALFLASVLFWVFWKREPRAILNAVLFSIVIVIGYVFVLAIVAEGDPEGGSAVQGVLAVIVIVPVVFVIGSIFLVLNGRTMIRREGRSLAHVLGPVVALVPYVLLGGIILGVIIGMVGGNASASIALLALAFVGTVYAYMLVFGVATAAYGAFYTLMPKNLNPDAIIIHGAGLINGKVSPLLRSRCDTALKVWQQGGSRALLVPSGGQGPDESRSEASAMAEYLLQHGVPPKQIVLEDESTTTDENMRLSKDMVDQYLGPETAVVFVTSNYHVFRTALIARRVGIDAQGVGSPTAGYYLPSAVIREIIAILVMYKWWHIFPLGIAALGFLFILMAAL